MLPGVAAIDTNKIAILGGSGNKGVIIYDAEQETAEEVATADVAINCYSEPKVDASNGDIYALVNMSGHKILKFSYNDGNKISFINELTNTE